MLGMEDKVSEEKRDELIGRIRKLCDNGTMRIRDWRAMYDIMLEACERAEAEAFERYMEDVVNSDGGDAQ
jgi:hypothetical protein